MKYIIFTDGGARGNPGPAATGIIVRNTNNEIIMEDGEFLGVATNNDAEYSALVRAITTLKEKGATEIDCYLDSELVVKQLKGQYKVKNDRMLSAYNKIKELEKSFAKITYTHIPRSKNTEADAIVNRILDTQK